VADASTFVSTDFLRASKLAIELHIFASRPFDPEASFESFSNPRATNFIDATNGRRGLCHVIYNKA
jgi:hypothetical protein